MNPWDNDPIVSPWANDPVVSPYEAQAKADTNTQNLLAGVGGAMYGPYLGIKQTLGLAAPSEIEEWKKSMAGLWSTPMGATGTVAGGAISAAPLAMIPGANTLGGAALTGAAFGAAQPVGEDESRGINAALGGAGGIVGKVGGDVIGNALSRRFTSKAAGLAAQKAQNVGRDATIQEVRNAGYTIPPTQVSPNDPGALNRLAEGFAGKLQTAQLAGIKNQPVTDLLAKKALGLSESTPLTTDTLKTVRRTAGTAYSQLKQMGPVSADADFGKALTGIAGEYNGLVAQFPSQKNAAIDALLADLNKPGFDSASIVDLVKRLRFDGFKNIRSPDPEKAALGQIQIGAQNALEDLIERNLAATGNRDFLSVFRNARAMIAKSYTVEKALEESTGKVVASKVGAEFAKGRPLTGELATIGKMAQAFPKAVQNVNTSMPGISPLDYAGGIVPLAGALMSGNPSVAALALTPFLRPVARSTILSKPWQRALAKAPTYQPGLLTSAMPSVANSPYAKLLEQSLGASLLPAIE